jgi:hypothetical protein
VKSLNKNMMRTNIFRNHCQLPLRTATAAVLLLPLAVFLLASACKPEAEETDDGNGVTYTVTAEDGVTTKTYTARALIQPQTVVASGITGACTWTITGTAGSYTLTISGAGAMADYMSSSDSPWYSYRNNIKTLVIQDGVTSIGNYAFDGCSGLTALTNHRTTPQSINSSVFYNVSLSACTLRVPSSAVNAYRNANYWKDFGTITGI